MQLAGYIFSYEGVGREKLHVTLGALSAVWCSHLCSLFHFSEPCIYTPLSTSQAAHFILHSDNN